VFRLPGAGTRFADSHPGLFSQLNRPTRGTTKYEGEGARSNEAFAIIEGVGTWASA
jgi:hypothetical protein